MPDFDLAIIGGGINGAGIARDAAGRGLRVLLVEQHDLASGTSSASTKLIHGGLRYLEHWEFRLVREALTEREVLLRLAPHIIWPLRFVLPHHAGLRPAWMLRLGLFLYDHLGGRKLLPPSAGIDLRASALGTPLRPQFTHAFEYSDCWVEDARLVVLNAMDARERGATIATRTRCVQATREAGGWRLALRSADRQFEETARILVNAAGPWVAAVSEGVLGLNTEAPVRLVKGSHIVVPRLYPHDRAYLLQNADGRVVFTIPYEGDFTLIGTTDVDYEGDPAHVTASASEIAYLCTVASSYFRTPVVPAQVVWSYAGVRPLYDDGVSKAKDATRDYVLTLDAPEAGGQGAAAPLLTVYGGKITTYRRLAEAALEKLAAWLPAAPAWTADAALPGGDFPWDGIDAMIAQMRRRWPFVDAALAARMARTHGTRIERVLAGVENADDLGPLFGGVLPAAELRYFMREEFAQKPDDVLWRRTKLGLRMPEAERAALAQFMRQFSASEPVD